MLFFFFSSRRRHTRFDCDWSSDVCSSDLGDALWRYGTNMVPLEYQPSTLTSPVFVYPYERSRDVLERMRKTDAVHPAHGLKMQYANPATGGYPMPTIAAFLQLLPAGFNGQGYR